MNNLGLLLLEYVRRRGNFAFVLIIVFLVCCRQTAGPSIQRPSDDEFLSYCKKGNNEQVADALRPFPEFIDVQDGVSELCLGDDT